MCVNSMFFPKHEENSPSVQPALLTVFWILYVSGTFLRKTTSPLSESVICVRLLQRAGFVWPTGEQLEVWPVWAPAFILISPRSFLSTLASLLLVEALRKKSEPTSCCLAHVLNQKIWNDYDCAGNVYDVPEEAADGLFRSGSITAVCSLWLVCYM